MAGATLAAAVVLGVVTGCGTSPSTGSASPASTTSTTASAVPAGHRRPPGIAGQITAVNGSTWTVTAKSGTRYTVTITARTAFGSKQHPASAQQFTVGSQVRIAGTVNGSTVTATRVVVPAGGGGSSAAPTPTG